MAVPGRMFLAFIAFSLVFFPCTLAFWIGYNLVQKILRNAIATIYIGPVCLSSLGLRLPRQSEILSSWFASLHRSLLIFETSFFELLEYPSTMVEDQYP